MVRPKIAFKNWMEGKWYEFEDTITLYHGTSTALFETIRENGIQPPDENIDAYARRVGEHYFPNGIPQEVWGKIEKYALSIRRDMPHRKIASVIYLSTSMKEATSYAQSYYKVGGEIANDIWRWANIYYCNQKGIDPSEEECIEPIYKDAKPVVLEVEIPYEWVLDKESIEAKSQHIMGFADKFEKDPEYYFSNTEFEVRVSKTIPPSMVVASHSV